MEPCPIARAYLASLRRLVNFDSILNESFLSALEDLEETATQGVVTRSTQHQRAFHCVTQAVGSLTFSEGFSTMRELDIAMPPIFDRSREGLTLLVGWLRGAMDAITCSKMEYAITRRMVRGAELGVEQLQQPRLDKLLRVYGNTVESAVVLRRSLKNPATRLGRVGSRWCESVLCMGVSVPHAFEMARSLLTITEENAYG